MAFTWKCGPDDFEQMGKTAVVGIGLVKKSGESDLDAALRAIEEGRGPVIPRYLYHAATPDDLTILDFGSGPRAMQARALRELGYNVTAFEWAPDPYDNSKRAQDYWDSVDAGIIQHDALDYTYDIIYASNVMNVQPTWRCFWTALNTIAASMASDTLFLCNLSREPRRVWANGRKGDLQLETMLMQAFNEVVRAEKSVPKSSDYIWRSRYWRGLDDKLELEATLDLIEDGYLTHQGGL